MLRWILDITLKDKLGMTTSAMPHGSCVHCRQNTLRWYGLWTCPAAWWWSLLQAHPRSRSALTLEMGKAKEVMDKHHLLILNLTPVDAKDRDDWRRSIPVWLTSHLRDSADRQRELETGIKCRMRSEALQGMWYLMAVVLDLHVTFPLHSRLESERYSVCRQRLSYINEATYCY